MREQSKNRLTCHNQQIKRFFLYPEPCLKHAISIYSEPILFSWTNQFIFLIYNILNQQKLLHYIASNCIKLELC